MFDDSMARSAPRRPATTLVARAVTLATLLLVAALSPSPALADETGGLRGIVTDPQGTPLAGVTVAVTAVGAGVPERGAVTGADGNFRIAGLPAGGGYALRYSLDGYGTVVVSGAEVRAREVTRVDALLTPAKSLRETVQVRATPPIVALEETATRTRFSSEFIDNLPILGRNYQDVLTLAPGVTDVDGDGNPNIHGARDTDVITLVDGLSTTDPLTGKIGAQMNLESIQEVEVKSSGASAEFGRAQGGFTSLLTKSGGNEFEGMFKFYWRGSELDGDGAGIDDPRLHGGVGEIGLRDLEFDDYLPFLSFSGPIARDRAWFYAALEYIQREEPVNALNAAFVTGLEEFRAFAKATWQVKPNLRLALSVNHDPQDFLNQGLNSRVREETGYTRSEGGTNLALQSVGILGPNVVLEAAIGWFDSRPGTEPNLGPDNNGNGILYDDRNHDGFLSPRERDGGEDYDGDGAFDIWEDTFIPNGLIDGMEVPDPAHPPFGVLFITEDADGSGDLTGPGECEGRNREDLDCDGHLDVDEDSNQNGLLDRDEDIDKDHRLDRANEDRNGDGRLNDRPFPADSYPYGTLRPIAMDRDYFIDESSGVISGPFYESYDDSRRRDTLKADLGVFVPDFHGSHDLRTGVVLERESFHRDLSRNDIVAFQPELEGTCDEEGGGGCIGGRPESYVTLLPTERAIQAEASGQSGGIYALDIYKPLPNLSLGLGVRFDREVARAPGYDSFDPRSERAVFDRLTSIAGAEIGRDDVLSGNRDGLQNRGIADDPLFNGMANPAAARGVYADPLNLQALRRLTRHRSTLPFTSTTLSGLYPTLFDNGVADPAALSALGITFQGEEPIVITNNNLAPRLSISWDPAADGRTKLYATWGRYYDKLFLSTVIGEQGPDILSRYYRSDADGLDVLTVDRLAVATTNHHIGAVLSQSPPSVEQVDRGLKTPYNDEWTVGFERELAPELALAVRFIHRDFRDQLQDIDINHEIAIDPAKGRPFDLIGVLLQFQDRFGNIRHQRGPDGKPDLYTNNYFFNQVLRVGNDNAGQYNALELELRKRMSRRWELQGSYVYSRAQGEAEDYQSEAGNDPSIIEDEFGYLDFDQRHVVKLSLGMFLPSDWQAGVTTSWASGLPYSVISRFFSLDNADYPQFRTRYGYTGREGDEAVFQSQPRNSQRNGSVYDLNLSARKNFVIGRSAASVSLEVFNVLNTDDLRIYTAERDQSEGFDLESGAAVSDALQLDAERRFGRRFQIGFQISF